MHAPMHSRPRNQAFPPLPSLQPLDVLRTRMQGDAAQGITRSAFQAGSEILRRDGLRGLWAGTGPSVARMAMGVGLHMVLVENLASALTRQLEGGSSHLSAVNAMLASGESRLLPSTSPVTSLPNHDPSGHPGSGSGL
jgi:hypothetical protein